MLSLCRTSQWDQAMLTLAGSSALDCSVTGHTMGEQQRAGTRRNPAANAD